jgi:hypothetical protein
MRRLKSWSKSKSRHCFPFSADDPPLSLSIMSPHVALSLFVRSQSSVRSDYCTRTGQRRSIVRFRRYEVAPNKTHRGHRTSRFHKIPKTRADTLRTTIISATCSIPK